MSDQTVGTAKDNLRKAVERVAVLRTLVKSRPGQHLVQTARGAGVVHKPLWFAVRQFGPPSTACYRLRGSGFQIFLRHRTRDVHILNEIFGGTAGRNSYEPPTTIASILDARPSLTVLDLGANIGLFAAYVLSRWPHASIRSFEPDPVNLSLLAHANAANEIQGTWSLADVAVSNEATQMSFQAGLLADSHLSADTDDGVVRAQDEGSGCHTITVRTVDIFAQDHDVDLMKMDIEGGEWAILTDSRLADLKADVLVLEWHANGCPEPDAGVATVRLLRAAGYVRVHEVEHGEENGLLWAWRENL